MKEVSRGDFEQHLETNSRIAEVGESYQSFNVMTKELRATEMLFKISLGDCFHCFTEPGNRLKEPCIDYDAMTVVTGDETLVLPKKEFLLLYKLAASPGRIFTKRRVLFRSLKL